MVPCERSYRRQTVVCTTKPRSGERSYRRQTVVCTTKPRSGERSYRLGEIRLRVTDNRGNISC